MPGRLQYCIPRSLHGLWLARTMIILLLLILGFQPFVATDNPLAQICPRDFSAMNDTTYKANLELLSTMLSRSVSSARTLLAKGFVGTDQDRTYGVTVCRGDIFAPACPSCITTAFIDAWRLCRPSHDTDILYEDCIVHISTSNLIYNSNAVLNRLLVFTGSTKDNMDPRIPIEVRTKYTELSIDDNIKELLQETAKQAAYNSTMRYATSRMDINNTFPLLYSVAQCNLDLPPIDCWDCLDNIRTVAKSFFYLQRGEWIASVWCNLRYNMYQFYKVQHVSETFSWIQLPNMLAPETEPGPAGLPRQKGENKLVCAHPKTQE